MVFNEYMPHLQVTLSWLLIIVELWVNSRKQFVSNTFFMGPLWTAGKELDSTRQNRYIRHLDSFVRSQRQLRFLYLH